MYDKREERKLDYQWLKSKGICTRCKNGNTINGKSLCEECAVKGSAISKIYYAKNRAEIIKRTSDYQKKKIEKRRNSGLCTRCGKNKAVSGKSSCLECTIRYRRISAEKRERQGIVPLSIRASIGMCYFCNNDVYDGKNICKNCYLKSVEWARKMREKYISDNHYWRKLNDLQTLRGYQ